MGMMSFNKMRRQNADKAEEPKEETYSPLN